ncbi:MAG TPA: hypothetical protein VIN72_03390 [Lutibacter sp.]
MVFNIIVLLGIFIVFKTLIHVLNYKENVSDIKIVQLLIVSIILLPSIKVSDSLPFIRFDDIIILLTVFTLIKRFPTNIITHILITFFFIVLFSNIIGAFKGNVNSIKDFFDLIFIFKIIVVYTLFYKIKNELDFRKIFIITAVCSLMSFMIAIMQYFNLFDINEKLTLLYTSTQTESLLNEDIFYRRVIGTFSNPNMYGIFATIISSITITYWLTKKSKYVYPLLILVFSITALFLTASRQSLTTFFIIFFIIVIFSLIKIKFTSISKIKIIFITSVIIMAISFMVSYSSIFNDRLTSIGNATSTGSVESRILVKWPYYLNKIPENIFFGIGTHKFDSILGSIDSEIILMVYSYGLIATFLYYLSIFYVIKIAYRNIQLFNLSLNKRVLSVFTLSLFIVLVEINLFSGTFWDMQLSLIVWAIAGLNSAIIKYNYNFKHYLTKK